MKSLILNVLVMVLLLSPVFRAGGYKSWTGRLSNHQNSYLSDDDPNDDEEETVPDEE